jgi:aryl-alcohol dehydrogenase-like predicted oxidoreductase
MAAFSPDAITIGGDMTVGRMGFGAMRVTGRGVWGDPPDRAAAIALLRRVVERGVSLIDTADSYGPGTSESLIAEALHPYPEGVIIATKGGLVRPGPDRWDANCRPDHLKQACEDSLKRLKLARIDLYQLHTVDSAVPLADQIGALVDLQRQGKIRHIGLSNVHIRELTAARRLATIVSVQNRYSVGDRAHDAVLDTCARDGLAFLPWYPLAAGSLVRQGGKLGGKLTEIAQAHQATPAQIALAWLLRRAPIMVPIPGTSSIGHFDENLAAARLHLSDAEFSALAGRA